MTKTSDKPGARAYSGFGDYAGLRDASARLSVGVPVVATPAPAAPKQRHTPS